MAQNGHAFQIPGQTNQAPFPAHLAHPSQQELTKAHHRFDNAEYRLHRLFAQRIEAASRLTLKPAFCKVVVASAVFLSCYFQCRLLPLWVECDGADRLPISRCP